MTRSEGLIYEMHHQQRIAKVGFFHELTSRSGQLNTARLCLGCLINMLIIGCSLPSAMPTDYMQIRWQPVLGVLPSEPIVLGLGLAMFLVPIQP